MIINDKRFEEAVASIGSDPCAHSHGGSSHVTTSGYWVTPDISEALQHNFPQWRCFVDPVLSPVSFNFSVIIDSAVDFFRLLDGSKGSLTSDNILHARSIGLNCRDKVHVKFLSSKNSLPCDVTSPMFDLKG